MNDVRCIQRAFIQTRDSRHISLIYIYIYMLQSLYHSTPLCELYGCTTRGMSFRCLFSFNIQRVARVRALLNLPFINSPPPTRQTTHPSRNSTTNKLKQGLFIVRLSLKGTDQTRSRLQNHAELCFRTRPLVVSCRVVVWPSICVSSRLCEILSRN